MAVTSLSLRQPIEYETSARVLVGPKEQVDVRPHPIPTTIARAPGPATYDLFAAHAPEHLRHLAAVGPPKLLRVHREERPVVPPRPKSTSGRWRYSSTVARWPKRPSDAWDCGLPQTNSWIT